MSSIRSRAAASAGHSAVPARSLKKCDFSCGVTNLMPDDGTQESEGKKMRWAYADGSGSNCHACERIWQTELSHHWKSRAEYKQALAANLATLEEHQARRQNYIARKAQAKTALEAKKALQ